MNRLSARLILALLLTGIMSLGIAMPLQAQEESSREVQLLTPYLGVAVEPGDTTTFDLELVAADGAEVTLQVSDVPDGWDARIRGGGFLVDRVLFDEDLSHNLRLEADVPADTPEGTYEMSVSATDGDTSDQLVFEMLVAEAAGGEVTLNAEFPALVGPSDIDFSFSLDLSNETTEEIQFGLQARGPSGWQVTARPSGQTRASTVTVTPGASERITVEVDPPDFTAAGTYPVVVQAGGSGETATTELTVEITGTFDLALVTPDERLNLEVEAGQSAELPLLVVNQGTAPISGVSLSATPPTEWEVSFSEETIDVIEPGARAEVTATVTPASNAISGDYRLTMQARTPETSDSVEVRASVETSAIWGLVGVGVILVALASLVIVFRRFGRR